MRVAYVTTYDATDIEQWSGTAVYIARTLELAGCELVRVNVGSSPLVAKAFARMKTLALGRRYLVDREPWLARLRARRLLKAVGDSVDLIFSPGTVALALLDTPKPIVFWTDATFGAMVDYYPYFSGLDSRTIRNGLMLETSALGRSAAAIYSSEWAARSAISLHGASPESVHVLPFGANIDVPTKAEVRRLIDARTKEICRLIFIGSEWHRKGGDIAVESARLLNSRGLPTELTVIGGSPQQLPPFVRNVGRLHKQRDADEFKRHLGNSHFLLLPSRAECAGVVFSEASAFGVPSLGANVGGVASQLHHGVNGYLVDAGSGPEAYADVIQRAIGQYDALAHSALDDYHARLSWACSAAKVAPLLDGLVRRART